MKAVKLCIACMFKTNKKIKAQDTHQVLFRQKIVRSTTGLKSLELKGDHMTVVSLINGWFTCGNEHQPRVRLLQTMLHESWE